MARRGPLANKTATVGATGSAPSMPADLHPAAQAVWRHYVPILDAMGLLTKADGETLRSFCWYAAKFHEYTARLETLDPVTPEHRRLTQTTNDAFKHLAGCIGELGLSPNSRARMRIESAEKVKNELAEFLPQKGG